MHSGYAVFSSYTANLKLFAELINPKINNRTSMKKSLMAISKGPFHISEV